MSVPQLGTYHSEDGTTTFQIQSANSGNGEIGGVYTTKNSPVGPIQASGTIGTYFWVFSDKAGKDGVAPFCISITANVRPDKREHAIFDRWAGAYCEDGTLLMAGSRSYVNSKGAVEVVSLGTHRFAR